MIFWTLCGLLIVLALAFVLPPLRHPDRVAAATTTTQANVAVYRRQLAEIESDRRHGILTGDQFLRDREELEQRLIVDLSDHRSHARDDNVNVQIGSVYYWLAVGLPLAAILLYLVLGTPPPL